jgi:hypothetical protein
LLEFGTLRPAGNALALAGFRARIRGINHKLRKLLVSAFKNRRALL